MAKVTVTFGSRLVGEYPLEKATVVVGRDASCDIHIDNLGISRAHCQFIKRGNTFILQDMNSANGTYVNGRRIGEHYLNDGDDILIGKFTLKFDAVHFAAEPKAEEPSAGMSDALRTYVVDGPQVRDALAEMRGAPVAGRQTEPIPPPPAAATAHETPAVADRTPSNMRPPPPTAVSPAPGTPPGPTAAPGPPPRRAIDHALDFDPLKPQSRPGAKTSRFRQRDDTRGMRGILYLSLVTNIVLIILVAVLMVFLVKMIDRQSPVPPGRPEPSPPAVPTPAAEKAAPSGERAK
jgi:predicted component of type VI protein secretion system